MVEIMLENQIVKVRIKASMTEETQLVLLYDWLDKWKHDMSSCMRYGGAYHEKYVVEVHPSAIRELHPDIVDRVERLI
jgi:hypothetical protein